ncbi:uncharacterized protein P884DRAFT_393 [Thermothelomyces heterothallicus CBS 202.75]|uniref:uncharacterized protein n=1 Tax=Thermothelomyces heterothallicus CBS 202.75 TaxID=1149848 RepID=UPI003743BBA0
MASTRAVSDGSMNIASYETMTRFSPLWRSRPATPTHGLPSYHNQPASGISQPFGSQYLAADEYPGAFAERHLITAGFDRHTQANASHISKQAEAELVRRMEAVELRSSEEQMERIILKSRLDKATSELERVVEELGSKSKSTGPCQPPRADSSDNSDLRSYLAARLAPVGRQGENPSDPLRHTGPAPRAGYDTSSRRNYEHDLDEGTDVTGGLGVRETAILAQKRPSLGTDGGVAETGAKRARRTHHATAEEGSDGRDDGLEWGREFLNFIKEMDCTSDEDLLRLKRYVRGRAAFEFPLCSETGGSRVEYFLKVGGVSSTLIAADPHDRPEQPKEDEARAEELNVLEFAVDERMARRRAAAQEGGGGSGGGPDKDDDHGDDHDGIGLPEYLVPLGEVYVANRSLNRPQEVASTNFFVLMRVDGPKKSLWMVYRYMRSFQRRNGPVWDAVAFGNQRDAHFKGSRRMFDTVCLLDDVRDWKDPAEDMITMERLANAVPGDERFFLQPVFFVPVLTALREALRKGWEEAEDDK